MDKLASIAVKILTPAFPFIIIAALSFTIGWSLGADKQPKILTQIRYEYLEAPAMPDVAIQAREPTVIYREIEKVVTDTVRILVPRTFADNYVVAPLNPIRFTPTTAYFRYADPTSGQISVNEYAIPQARPRLHLGGSIEVFQQLRGDLGARLEANISYGKHSFFGALQASDRIMPMYGYRLSF